MYKLKIETIKKGTIELNFTMFDKFVWVVGHQIGIFHGYVNEQDGEKYCKLASDNFSERFQEKEKLGVFDTLNESSTIVDIGSGVGILDLVLHKYINGGNFVLVDKSVINHENMTNHHWNENHGFYNDWDVFRDIAFNSNINTNNFSLLSPDDLWPINIDLIMSSYSYMWHYSKEAYWNKILPYAKNKTHLCFDILNNKDVENEITNELNKPCISIDKPKLLFHWFVNEIKLHNGSPGKICYWK